MLYANIKNHKKPGFHPLFRRYIFWKTTVGGGGGISQINLPPPPSRLRAKPKIFYINTY